MDSRKLFVFFTVSLLIMKMNVCCSPDKNMSAVFGLTLAEDVESAVTFPVIPAPFLHSNTCLRVVFIIGLITPPLSERGAAAV